MGFKIKKISSKRIAVLTDENRVEVLEKIEKQLNGKYDRTPTSASSVGMVKVGGVSILAKPANKQGIKSAGLDNEHILVEIINQKTKTGPINITFISGNKKFEMIGVTSAVSAGSDTTGRKKSDVNIISKKKTYPISIKKDNAEYWESADSYAGEIARKVLEKAINDGLISLTDGPGGTTIMSKNIAYPATTKEKRSVIFGSDIENSGCVIKRTFSKNDFKDDGNNLTIQVSEIITSLSDINKDNDVWFLIRQDKSRNNKMLGYKGLRILAAYEKRINRNVIRVKRR